MCVCLPSVKSWISPLRAFLLPLLVVLGGGTTPQLAIAQSRNFSTYFLDVVPSKFVAAALAQPYGQAVVMQFAAALNDSADPACLRAKSMTTEQLTARARAMLLERGTYMLERLISMTDRAAFKNYLRARIGSEGVTELERLRANPDVRAYRAVDEPAQLAFIAAYIVENIDRFMRINRIKLARPISPMASDIASIQSADPTDKIDARLKEMVANDKSGAVARYVEITAFAQKPFADAADMNVAKKFGPGQLMARPRKGQWDLQDELAKLCVAPPTTRLR
jgi:hypothetical protein